MKVHGWVRLEPEINRLHFGSDLDLDQNSESSFHFSNIDRQDVLNVKQDVIVKPTLVCLLVSQYQDLHIQ